ncbi:MAG: CBS domain-containing protein [Myxococcota bacterium]
MTEKPTVADYMATNLHTLTADADIRDAVDFLLEHRISGAPVIGGDGALVGVISEKDCLRLLAKGDDHQRASGTVADFMTREPATVPSTMDVYFAAGVFLTRPYRRFPVVDDGKLVGQISRRDILTAIQSLMPR